MNTVSKTVRYTLDAPDKTITNGKLSENGGSNRQGRSFGFTNYYMTQNGHPFIPIVGEFHFSRFSYLHWEEELLKMKAGGVHIVATYIFWNFHEEEEGHFNWGGDLNLRHFIDLCAKLEMPLILRMGPFCHGEVRNGGIPDWVFKYPIDIRSNDPGYLKLAKQLYREIAKQMKGSLFQEGGPVIAVQLENEFMHCGAPYDSWGYKSGVYLPIGTGGNEHLAELRRLAEEVGIDPLLFTVTAWGGAAVPHKGTLPMLAGYAYTPWIPNQPPSQEFLYRDLHRTPAEPVNYDSLDYPVAYCEMAGGMQVSYNARPYVPAASIEAMTLVKLASGSNLLGYYMYHGGSNPTGKHSYYNETSLPKITYDYQSPLGEFGRVGPSYDRIRSISMFLESFGDVLAPMGTVLPEGQSEVESTDVDSLRWCLRQQGGSGFLFLNNFQDHLEMQNQELRLELDTKQGPAVFPQVGSMTLRNGQGVVFPFNLPLAGLKLISATAQLLTKLESAGNTTIVFYAHEGIAPELVLQANGIQSIDAGLGSARLISDVWLITPVVGKSHSICITAEDGASVTIIILSRKEAMRTYRLSLWGEDRLVIGDSEIEGFHLYAKDGQLLLHSPGSAQFAVSLFPAPPAEPALSLGTLKSNEEGLFRTYYVGLEAYTPELEQFEPSERSRLLKISSAWPQQVDDIYLHIDYEGDVAAAYLANRLLTDHIQYGHTWNIGLKQVKDELESGEVHLLITPLRKGTLHSFVNQAYVEVFEGVEIATFQQIQAVPHYKSALYLAI
ncbi:beta-galactosidase [Paenibacillus sp. 19GGS1-52]|uniref:beta-galactosidase n=1 Tax=Paenibacillus sp. 19GGS1-52 TaxID=2758563 RepID=UPI001EFB6E32|nr:beta-galactosidase [Paenibacillus sp. 19GGS1-52]ULO09807.1 beta-galactosidase [Paenibacillus sp. 19GGS1-52]